MSLDEYRDKVIFTYFSNTVVLAIDVPLLIPVAILYGIGKKTECNGGASNLLLAYIIIKSIIKY